MYAESVMERVAGTENSFLVLLGLRLVMSADNRLGRQAAWTRLELGKYLPLEVILSEIK